MKKIESVEDFIHRKNLQFEKEKSPIPMKDITRTKKNYFTREAWTFMPQHNYGEKVFVIERLRKEEDSKIEYRLGYYIVGKIGRANGRWIWGQFCPLIPKEDFLKLIEKAKREKTIV